MTILQAQQIMLSDPAHARKPHAERFAAGSAFINGQYCGVHEAAIPIVDMGIMGEGSRADADAFDNCFYAFVIPYLYIANDEQRSRGLDIMVSRDHIRIPPKAVDPTAKNRHWMDMKLSLFEAADNGKEWTVLVDAEGNLTEAAGAIMPINSVDDVVLGGEPGPGKLTTALHNRYWERLWNGWLAGNRD
jgi:branched-subunit amino acid aminotransferase/4-amino-4-deoxychorismate lyase